MGERDQSEFMNWCANRRAFRVAGKRTRSGQGRPLRVEGNAARYVDAQGDRSRRHADILDFGEKTPLNI